MKKVLTLCIIHEPGRVLLGLKKRGFGMGRWNGFGGKVQEGETIEEAARREVMEEAGIAVMALEKRGVINFVSTGDPTALEVHVFSAREWSGEPRESEEMKPQWFSKDKIPFHAMWLDDPYWFPLFFAGKRFRAAFAFENLSTILSSYIQEVNEL